MATKYCFLKRAKFLSDLVEVDDSLPFTSLAQYCTAVIEIACEFCNLKLRPEDQSHLASFEIVQKKVSLK